MKKDTGKYLPLIPVFAVYLVLFLMGKKHAGHVAAHGHAPFLLRAGSGLQYLSGHDRVCGLRVRGLHGGGDLRHGPVHHEPRALRGARIRCHCHRFRHGHPVLHTPFPGRGGRGPSASRGLLRHRHHRCERGFPLSDRGRADLERLRRPYLHGPTQPDSGPGRPQAPWPPTGPISWYW